MSHCHFWGVIQQSVYIYDMSFQDVIRHSVYMVVLMEQLGLRVDEEGILYPRIPTSLEVPELVNMALALGEVDESM